MRREQPARLTPQRWKFPLVMISISAGATDTVRPSRKRRDRKAANCPFVASGPGRTSASGRTLPFNTYPLIDRFLGAIAREQTDHFRPVSGCHSQHAALPGSADSVEKLRKQSLLAISGRAGLCRRTDDSIFQP
jgi:hypothetical protein